MSPETIQWYPGHMKKADRKIREQLKLIDTVIEVVDARAPLASRNPDIKDYTERKNHILLLNKADLADREQLECWREHFNSQGMTVVTYNALDNRESGKLKKAILKVSDSPEKRCLVVGIPNVGKSAVINSLVGKKKTQTGNKPGVTKGQQWLKSDENFLLLDTPGILWPKFKDQTIAEHLTWIAAISDKRYEVENVAGELIKFLVGNYPERLESLYNIEIGDDPAWVVFEKIAESRKLLVKGGEYDYRRTSEMILNDFRNGRLGGITIERC